MKQIVLIIHKNIAVITWQDNNEAVVFYYIMSDDNRKIEPVDALDTPCGIMDYANAYCKAKSLNQQKTMEIILANIKEENENKNSRI